MARSGPGGTAMQERARDVIAQLNRLDLSDENPDNPGPAFTDGEMEPVERLQRGLSGLVHTVRAGRPGKVVVCIEGLDRLRPDVRWQVLDGLRLDGFGQCRNRVVGCNRWSGCGDGGSTC